MKHGKTNEVSIAYIHGRIDQQIEAYAQSLGIPTNELAIRLATLLYPEGPGPEHSLPTLRGKVPEVGEAVGEMEVHGRPHRKTQERKKRAKSGAKGYWDSMTKAERAAEMQRRVAKRRANAA